MSRRKEKKCSSKNLFIEKRDKSFRGYRQFLSGIQQLLDESRRQAARSVNAVLTVTYWKIGYRIVKFEQGGKTRAGYGEALIRNISKDLTARMGKGFGFSQVKLMRQFYLAYKQKKIGQSVTGQLENPKIFPLSWTHYVRLLSVENVHARDFYHAEALRGGWSVRQLDRQINSGFYERAALSNNKVGMLKESVAKKPHDQVVPEEEIRDPYVLEFLGLKDEYSESDLEEGLIRHLESFLLELGRNFTFVARQKRLRVGNEWYRVDLVFYHRMLRCLVLIDLKIGKFTHADAGQMHLYLNYAREHWTNPTENPPIGLILCAEKDAAVAHYALEGLPNKILASEYRMALPGERQLAAELKRTRKQLENRITT